MDQILIQLEHPVFFVLGIHPFLFLIPIVLIEFIVGTKIVKNEHKKIFWGIFWANLISAGLKSALYFLEGFTGAQFFNLLLSDLPSYSGLFLFVFLGFIYSTVIEFLFLRYYWIEWKQKKVFKITVIVNFITYLLYALYYALK